MDDIFIPNVIDIEASGFGKGSYPIEVGFITSEKLLKCCLIKPQTAWRNWDDAAQKIHGISREILHEKGKSIKEVALWLNHYLKGQTIYSDAWLNDMCWLGCLYEEAEITQAFRLVSILELLNETERDMWAGVYQTVLQETKLIRHRASSDAKLIQETFIRIKTNNFNKDSYKKLK